jgi:hypothetical protein
MRFWDEQRQLWWQVSWRAPDLQPGTVLLVNLPSQRYFEDYEVWAPANLIYSPGDRTPDLAAQVVEEETARLVRLGAKDTRYMRVLIGIPRDYRSSLVVDWPSSESCVHVIDPGQPEAGLTSSSLVRSMAEFSKEMQVVLEAQPARPDESLFGAEPARGWCWYFQQASLARQRGDWAAAAALGRTVLAEGWTPGDRSEWMPFFQGLVNEGQTDDASIVAAEVLQDPGLAEELCARLGPEHFADAAGLERARSLLCSDAN